MSWGYRTALRPVLFRQDSEKIHDRTLRGLAWASRRETVCRLLTSFFGAPELPVEAFGLRFPNPVGLAAGMDKRAVAVPVWEALGFGFSELGGVTWQAQPGNPAPRMFRAVTDRALINRMGFNNAGAEAMAAQLAEWRSLGRWPKHPVGINLGKSKITPLTEAAEDYARSLRALWPLADFFVVNVSSPNTPGLRQLQDRAALDEILAALQATNRSLGGAASVLRTRPDGRGVPPHPALSPKGGEGEEQDIGGRVTTSTKPILVKVAPDLSFEALDEILQLAGPREISGMVATNTTVARPHSDRPELQRIYAQTGGLSGRPLAARSTEVIRHIHRQTGGKLPIIGVGGIFNAADAWEKITAGACLVQIYTGLVYEGPGLVKDIVTGLRARLKANGFAQISQAVGSSAR